MVGELQSAHIIVKGAVQGVGFRFYTRRLASQLGLSGFVRNLEDSTVEIEVEGSPVQIDQLISDFKTGEMAGYIADLEIHWRPFEQKYRNFSIEL